jgi:hypothetical protein
MQYPLIIQNTLYSENIRFNWNIAEMKDIIGKISAMISGGIFSSNVIPNYNNIAYRRLTK